jgi:hypothetical protein
LERLDILMAIDPNSINPDEIKKLVVEGLDCRPDGGLSVQCLQTHADPAFGEKEMEAVRKTARSWRELHKDSQIGNLSEEERLLGQAAAQRLRAELLDATSRAVPSAASAIAAAAQHTAPPLRPTSLRDGFERYLKSKKKIVQSTKDAYTKSFELFAEMIGGDHRLAHEIRPVEIKEFNDALAFIPLHAKKRGIKLGTTQAILKNPPKLEDKNGNPIDAFSGNSANLCVANIKSFFDYLIKSGRRDGDNPFENLPKHSDGQTVGGADGFDEHELRAIFNPETFMQAKSPSQFGVYCLPFTLAPG